MKGRKHTQTPQVDIKAQTHTHTHVLLGELRGPAPPMVLAVMRSAMCRNASRPAGLLPLVVWSWIRPSSSSLNTYRDRDIQLRHRYDGYRSDIV